MATPYGPDFYSAIGEGSRRSASVIVPMIMDLVRPLESVVDVGCGTGQWLAEFVGAGIDDVLGLDGDYVDRAWLAIPAERFCPTNLASPSPLSRRFDLALCLEVAEHLPEASADGLVRYLTEASDVVAFSAAIPYQGGEEHLNEQWPGYWAEKFEAAGYLTLDPFRARIWNDDRVERWFAQNTLLFVRAERLEDDDRLAAEKERSGGPPLPLVHPLSYIPKAKIARRVATLYERRVVRVGAQTLRRLRVLR